MTGLRRFVSGLCLLVTLGGCASGSGTSASGDPEVPADPMVRVVDRRIVMGVEAVITTWAPDEATGHRATRAAFARMAALEQALSDYRPRSEAMQAVEQVGIPVAISPSLFEALSLSGAWHRRSGGAFDPTIGPLTSLWRRCRGEGRLPNRREVDFAAATVGWGKLELEAETVTFRTAAMGLDFGGIGKGLAGDLALEVMRAHGLARSLVDIGGDLVAGSPPPGRDGWRVRIETVEWDDARILDLVDAAVATSGDVTQYLDIEQPDGTIQRFGHLLDPRTGRPVELRREATAVVSGGTRNGANADALASVGVILGLRGTARVADGTLDAEVRVVEAAGSQADAAVPADWTVDTLRFASHPSWAGDFDVETLGEGFGFTEGPVVRSDGSVWFTDQPNDRIVRWTRETGCEVMIEPARRANGLGLDPDGRLLACAEAGHELVVFDDEGRAAVLATGRPSFNGPNDLWSAPDGTIWFTDPWYRRPWHEGDDWRRSPAVHCRLRDGRIREVADDFGRPNGIVGTRDGGTLYVADIDRGVLWRYAIESEARLGPREKVIPLGSDGMTIDTEGMVVLTGRGVMVVDPVRDALVRTLLPDEGWCANVVDGPDGLYVTARTRLLRVSPPRR